MRDNSNLFLLLNQTAERVRSMCNDNDDCNDDCDDEYKDLCKEASTGFQH